MEGKREGARAGRSEAFPRRYRLGGNRNYRYVYRRGKSYPSRNLVLIHLKGRDLKIGFSVSGKVGNAVTRNRIRRCMRENVRKMRT
jgi:ribonuclease P protein component